MKIEPLINSFTKKFIQKKFFLRRGIGIECEMPIVNQEGESINYELVEQLFYHLGKNGFSLKKDIRTKQVIAATKINEKSAKYFDYCIDTITTDLGCGILEIALAPQDNIFDLHYGLHIFILLISDFFELHNCKILGYGIHPLTAPSKGILVPHKEYNFKNRVSGNKFVQEHEGKDFHLLTITASNQCHVDVCLEETIPVINVLNSLVGLQIALNANSPIWRGKIDSKYKANRELFWDFCFADRLHQAGMPKKFKDIEDYVQTLTTFMPQRVIRNGYAFRIDTLQTFKEFIENDSLIVGENRFGAQSIITPKIDDIHTLNSFCYYDAKLVSKFGTVESRMCCQQPPGETLTTAALTLGIVENLAEAMKLMNTQNWESWRQLKKSAIKNAIGATINKQPIHSLLRKFLDISRDGLLSRKRNEEVFLMPLYKRLKTLKSPADLAIETFEKHGMYGLLNSLAFNKEVIASDYHFYGF